ncbi:hypothetical protein [Kribbella shirazensis]|uniref:Uncharacterized protein n=1 Tax=Kribbella shirazensis TaxID=1105143 RepID=A0A7X6A069_9ACTN|nr:hypothetical protein [Kribbella shirazensis]NIK56822.1 hypothetical protein [Kribbella shirazensis]
MPTGPKGFILRPGAPVAEFVLFLSSGNDLLPQRDLFDALVRAVDEQFRIRRDQDRPFVLRTDRWEQDAPLKTPGDPNAEFVRRAQAAHATVVLLWGKIRRGTRAEIEGVLEQDDVQLSVIWMRESKSIGNRTDLARFLKRNQDKFMYLETGPPGSEDATCAMVTVIAAALADITHSGRRQELFNESR